MEAEDRKELVAYAHPSKMGTPRAGPPVQLVTTT